MLIGGESGQFQPQNPLLNMKSILETFIIVVSTISSLLVSDEFIVETPRFAAPTPPVLEEELPAAGISLALQPIIEILLQCYPLPLIPMYTLAGIISIVYIYLRHPET